MSNAYGDDRKRMLSAGVLTVVAYGAIAVFCVLVFIAPKSGAQANSGPILVRIGTVDGLDSASGVDVKVPESQAPQTSVATESPGTTENSTPEAQSSSQNPAVPTKPHDTASTTKVKPAQNSGTPTTTSQPSNANANSTQTSPAKPDSPPAKVVKGEEKGNSHETTFNVSTGKTGRAFYAPIYQYMPLPKNIPNTVFERIPPGPNGLPSAEKRKATIAEFYVPNGSFWELNGEVPKDRLNQLWSILEDARYDLAHADYKQGLRDRTIVKIQFTLGPDAQLSSVRVIQSSGYPYLDESVIYGLQQSQFSNDTGQEVSGTFVYTFGGQ